MTPLEMARAKSTMSGRSIRDAVAGDTPHILKLLRELFDHAGRRGEYRVKEVEGMVHHLRENGILLISDKGIIGGLLAPIWPTGEIVAREIVWWRDPALLTAFEKRSREMGATAVQLTALKDRVARHYEKRGFRKLETTYLKEFSQ